MVNPERISSGNLKHRADKYLNYHIVSSPSDILQLPSSRYFSAPLQCNLNKEVEIICLKHEFETHCKLMKI